MTPPEPIEITYLTQYGTVFPQSYTHPLVEGMTTTFGFYTLSGSGTSYYFDAIALVDDKVYLTYHNPNTVDTPLYVDVNDVPYTTDVEFTWHSYSQSQIYDVSGHLSADMSDSNKLLLEALKSGNFTLVQRS